MTILANYGIYLIVDIDTFNTTIVQSDPTWNFYQLRSYEHVIAAFAQYDNVLGFFAGNEIVNEPDGTVASPYVKASVRDAKQFIQSQGYRTIPVGYSAADIAEIRPAFQNYLVCEDGATNYAASAIDFFGLNIYEVNFQDRVVAGFSNLFSGVEHPPTKNLDISIVQWKWKIIQYRLSSANLGAMRCYHGNFKIYPHCMAQTCLRSGPEVLVNLLESPLSNKYLT